MSRYKAEKCDECRRRKIKCDALRPTCSNCIDRRSVCRYSIEIQKFVPSELSSTSSTATPPEQGGCATSGCAKQITLSVRAVKTISSGRGAYHTFAVTRAETKRKGQSRMTTDTCQLSWTPTCASSRLATQLCRIISESAQPGFCLQLLGAWLKFIPQRLGQSELLDCAAACVIASHTSKFTSGNTAGLLARARYGRAMQLLRESISAKDVQIDASHVAATKLLMAHELLSGADQPARLSHANGTVNMLVAIGPAICASDDVTCTLLYSSFHEAASPQPSAIRRLTLTMCQWQHAVRTGQTSAFDRAEWTSIRPCSATARSYSANDHQMHVLLQTFTKLPRLILLARQWRQGKGDRTPAMTLLQDLLAVNDTQPSDFDDLDYAHETPRTAPEDAAIVPTSLTFPPSSYYTVIARSSLLTGRLILNGLCQTLMQHDACPEGLDGLELQQQDRRMAELVCKLVDYAASMAPYGTAGMMLPMLCAWGAFRREYERSGDLRAADKMAWLLRKSNEFAAVWVSEPITAAQMGAYVDLLQG